MRTRPGPLALLVGALFAACLAACGANSDGPLRVDAAASLREVTSELARLHAERTGKPLPRVNLAGSGELARQVRAARKTDVFLSAGAQELDGLEADGLVVPGTRRALCSNSLVVVALEPRPDFDLAQLVRADHVAVAHTELVPAGRYAAAWLRRIGLLNALEGKLSRAANVRAALAAVQSGACEYGIVYASDLSAAPELRVVHRVPSSELPAIEYAGVVLVDAPDVEEARAFLEFCTSDEGRAIFERHGLLPAHVD
ncbi:MAG: molybdate ABC transporter substrate-binding protein [Planctomycetes bacterium]|nr:molybdate ABC transporter substrate-binding protein [Planctomycetota bacterium]MCB9905601.1 molybdate ABC transporter substrate-binding protein [Planctomycetota bacterium]